MALAGYPYFEDIELASVALSLSGDVAEYPVDVLIPTDSPFWDNAPANGNHVRFTKTDDTLLDYRMIDYDTTASAEYGIWKVESPVLSATNTIIRMWYGHASPTDGSNAPNTFESSFLRAWPMDANYSGGAFADPTGNADLTNDGSTDRTGAIGQGRDFVTDDKVYGAAHADFEVGSFTLALTAIRDTDPAGYDPLVDNRDAGNSKGLSLSAENNSRFFLWTTGGQELATAVGAFSNGIERRVVITYDAGTKTMKIYVDGLLKDTTVNANAYLPGTSEPFEFGTSQASGGFHDGMMDEIYWLNEAKDLDWVKVYNASILSTWISYPKDIEIAKVDFNFTEKTLTVAIVTPTAIAIPVATFNFSRFAPVTHTTNVGIGISKATFDFIEKGLSVDVTGHFAPTIPVGSFNFTGYVCQERVKIR